LAAHIIMPKIKMTAVALARLKPPPVGQVDYFDAGFPALALRISASAVRSWVYFGRVHGKLKRATLGRYPGMSLAQARRKATEAADAMAAGINPAAAKREARASAKRDDLEAVIEQWLERDQARNRSAREVRRTMELHVIQCWKGRPFPSISRRDVIELLDRIGDTRGPAAARKLHAHLHRLFRWALGRSILAANPMTDLPLPGRAVSRDRVLADDELSIVWKAAATIGWPFGPIFQLLILTGARRAEIGSLQWAEIDGDTIRLARERVKNAEPQAIPLSAAAVAVLANTPRMEGGDFIFTTTSTTPVSGWSRAKQLLDNAATNLNDGAALKDWRLHDLRRTVATGLQRLGVELQVIEAVLGHVSGSRAGIVGVYQRHSFEPEKRLALEAWARHIEAIVSEGQTNVVSFARKATP
jgi:integrase